MDIHELKQFESVYQPSKEIAFCWGVKKYVQLSVEENHTEIVDHANDSLRIWQAAKAQAVPEGFVLVERTDLECAIDALKWASNEDGDLCAKQAGVLEDVLKAQEPANV